MAEMTHADRAKVLARLLHAGQVDKGGRDYFQGHLTRVAGRVIARRGITDWAAQAVAWLHDAVEDTPLELHDLDLLGFPDEVVTAVYRVTRPADFTYAEFIEDIASSGDELALAVKLADVEDHLEDTSAIPGSLVRRYERALERLQEAASRS